jgi:predicted nuclease of predicted toxin-antitoxin system
VTTTVEAGLRGALDPEHVAWALAEGRVIFTQDRDFIILHRSGISHLGIVYCHSQSASLSRIIYGLQLVWEVYEPEEMHNRLEYI